MRKRGQWEQVLTKQEAERLLAAYSRDRAAREVRGLFRQVVGLRPMQWRNFIAAATEIAATHGFVPDGPGEFMVWQTTTEPPKLSWSAR